MNVPARRQDTPWEYDYWTPEPWWQGEQVFVIASGPSLTQEICDKIKGRKAIVINASFRLAPWAPVWFFTDSHIYEKYREEVAAWPGEVITMSRTAKRELNHRVKRVKGEGDPSLFPGTFPPIGHPAIRQGRNSGNTAVSLAIALGAARVALVGFDCRVVETEDSAGVKKMMEHHHNEYSGPRDLSLYSNEFRRAFDGWNVAALNSGVTILNLTPDSAITEFPFADLDEVLTCDPSRR